MKKCCVLLVFLHLLCFGTSGNLPSNFKVCKRFDPAFSKCFSEAVKHALPLVKDSLPELGIPSIEPMKIQSIIVAPSDFKPVNVAQNLKNIEIFNLASSDVTKAEATLGSKPTFSMHTYNYQLKVEADYDINGNVLLLPIVGNGKAHVDLNQLNTDLFLSGELFERSGKTYIKITDVKMELEPGNVHFNLENLYNGNQGLADQMQKVLNFNWRLVFEKIRPAYAKAFADYFKNVFQAVFAKVPYDELFPL